MHRLLTLSIATVLVLVGAVVALEARRQIGKPFPGFLVLENGVVPSVGFGRWPATRDGRLFQYRVAAVDGVPVAEADSLLSAVAAQPIGSTLHYRFESGGDAFERDIAIRRFDARDFASLYGVYLMNGLIFTLAGLVVALRRSQGSLSAVPFLVTGALWGLTAIDLYGPYRFFRLHALAESFLFASILQLALCFPARTRIARDWPGLVLAPYAASAVGALFYQVALNDPATYRVAHLLCTTLNGAALIVLLSTQLAVARCHHSLRAHWIRLAIAGSAFAAVLPAALLSVGELWTGGRMPQNAIGYTAFLLPMALLAVPGRMEAARSRAAE